jgi:AcrR family transcriptional regulator
VRRKAILRAALLQFAEAGFAAARLDDVAARAGVAKGTLYLYFPSKEVLFEDLVREAIAPIMARLEKLAASHACAIKALEAFFALFEREVLRTERKLLLRLIIAEGARFPTIAAIYHREVVSVGLRLLRQLAERAAAEGAFPTAAASRYPQLIVAPLLLAVIWDGLFTKLEPLNVQGLLRAHREVLTGRGRGVP